MHSTKVKSCTLHVSTFCYLNNHFPFPRSIAPLEMMKHIWCVSCDGPSGVLWSLPPPPHLPLLSCSAWWSCHVGRLSFLFWNYAKHVKIWQQASLLNACHSLGVKIQQLFDQNLAFSSCYICYYKWFNEKIDTNLYLEQKLQMFFSKNEKMKKILFPSNLFWMSS